jgi:sodium/bile acid cotransporter 7
MATLFLVTLPIESARIATSLRRPGPALLATFVSYVMLPLMAWFCSRWLPSEFGLGLLVCASTPSTIASAAVWTRRAGGNEMVAIFVTLLTNLLCFAVMPMWLSVSFGRSVEGISFADMAVNLALLVVLPMACGQLARRSRRVAVWSTRNRHVLSIAAQAGVLTIVLIGAIQCGLFVRQQQSATAKIAASLPVLLVTLVGLNLMAFFAGKWLASWFSFTNEEAIGVAFSGSQKTLMVGLQVAMLLGGGVIILPMVMYHVLQLIVGTILADQIASSGRLTEAGRGYSSVDGKNAR